MAKAPTNTDIIKLLTLNHEETSKRLDGVEAQVKYTNGQVSVLKQWKAEQQAIEKYKQAQPTVQVNNQQTDWPKILMFTLGLLGTALAIISSVVVK